MGDLLGSPRVAPLFFVFIFILTICRVEISIDFRFISFFIFYFDDLPGRDFDRGKRFLKVLRIFSVVSKLIYR